jgi:GT2 family glycosyltransferase
LGYPTLSAAETHLYEASIVIVSFNTKDTLRQCLESVERESAGLQIETFVVDNNSADGSPRMVEDTFPAVHLIKSSVNLGFGAANNLAIQAAKGRYLILLNSDAFLGHQSLKLAIEHMDHQPNVALGGARLVGRDLSWQPSARMFPSIRTDALVMTGLAARFPHSKFFGHFDRTWADPAEPSAVDWVPGAFSIVRPEVLEKVGLFDPRFFLYGEEVDLCRRIKSAGYEIWYWPDILVTHVGGESSRHRSDVDLAGAQITLWRMRSTLLYYRKHHGSTALLSKWLELLLYRVFSLRNLFSTEPWRKLRRQKYNHLAAAMRSAWVETDGGRTSPPRPW